MYYATSIVTLAFAAAASAWPSHGNSTTRVIGSLSAINGPSVVPTGSVSSSRGSLSTGIHGPIPSASGSGSGNNGHHTTGASGSGRGSPVVTPGPPPKITYVTVPGVSSTITETHLITKTSSTVVTKFVPCSTAIATDGGATYYSSSLTTSLITATKTSVLTEYTVICPTPKLGGNVLGNSMASSALGQGQDSSSGHGSGAGAPGEVCPPASTVYHTVYITIVPSAESTQTVAPGSPSSPGNSIPKPQPPFQSQPNVPPYPLPSNHPSAPLPSGSGSSRGPSGPTGTQPIPTGTAKPSGLRL